MIDPDADVRCHLTKMTARSSTPISCLTRPGIDHQRANQGRLHSDRAFMQ
jgi:hypothetical protein